MTSHHPLIRVNTHEKLAGFSELVDVLWVMCDELLNCFGVAEVAEVTKDGHEAFGFEWEAVNV